MKKIPLHWRILLGMFLGVIYAILFGSSHVSFSEKWISPFGEIFINALKLIAVPLILFSLVSGIAGLKNVAQLSSLGKQTIFLYLITTVLSVTIGLVCVNIIEPWNYISPEALEMFQLKNSNSVQSGIHEAVALKKTQPLQFIKDLVPENLLAAASANRNMLQVIVFALLFGIALMKIDKEKAQPVIRFFEGVNDVILKIVDFIMIYAPFGTFALIAVVFSKSGDVQEMLGLTGVYMLTVLIGLLLIVFGLYPLLLKVFSGQNLFKVIKGIAPAQLLAFSTSSSAATLPVTMECAQENLGVEEEVSSFVLPLGATINMDGTSCYQAVAAVFIAHVLGYDLSAMDQLSIVVTATLASIGSAAVPGAGMVMLAVVLEQIGVEMEGIVLIIGVDRLLDMCRTVVNVTGDSTVALIINKWNNN